MKKRTLIALAALLLSATILTIYSCKKGDQGGDAPSQPTYTPGNVIATIHGRILNETKNPLTGAVIQVGTRTTTTDINGEFHLTNVTTDRFSTFVKVTKDGYFSGGRTLIVNDKAINYLEVALLPNLATYFFTGSSGGNISVSSKVSVNFPANAIIDGNTGTAYTGQVTVNAAYLDPTDADFQNKIPGDLRGITVNNEERGLQSFGMVVVELKGNASNQKLKLAAGKTAELTFSIPASLVASAPATIPLWYFDETKGLWKEEGSATKQGDKYVGQVSHFSFWNVDMQFPTVSFEARLVDQNNNPVAGSPILIKKIRDSIATYAYTDSSGKVSGFVPANEQLQLKVLTKCRTENYTQNIGPYSGAVNLGDIKVNLNATAATVAISGTSLKCGTNQPLDSGTVTLFLDGSVYQTTINKGRYSFTANRCSANPTNADIFVSDNILHLERQTLYNVTTGNVTANTNTVCTVGIKNIITAWITGPTAQNYDLSEVDSFDLQISAGTAVVSSVKKNGKFFTSFTLKGDLTSSSLVVESLIMTDVNGKRYTGSGTATTGLSSYSNEILVGNINAFVRDESNVYYNASISYYVKRKK